MKKIEVTSKDIELGRPGQEHYCPIALAVSRVFPQYYVDVGEFYLRLSEVSGKLIASIRLSDQVRSFVANFDNSHYVEPFVFELEEEPNGLPTNN